MEFVILLGICVVIVGSVAWIGRRRRDADPNLVARTNREVEARLRVLRDSRRGMQ